MFQRKQQLLIFVEGGKLVPEPRPQHYCTRFNSSECGDDSQRGCPARSWHDVSREETREKSNSE